MSTISEEWNRAGDTVWEAAKRVERSHDRDLRRLSGMLKEFSTSLHAEAARLDGRKGPNQP